MGKNNELKRNRQKSVVVYGGGSGGERYIYNQDEYSVVGIIDSDYKKQGKQIMGINIYSPMKLKKLEYNYVIIASMFYKEILKYLQEELHVPREKILLAPKSLLKEYCRPFEDVKTRKLARECLKITTNILENKNINYFLDYGTLLGIIREKDIIQWDDDIDISVLADYEVIIETTELILKALNNLNVGLWKKEFILDSDSNLIDVQIHLKADLDYNNFNISIKKMKVYKDKVINKFIDSPRIFFEKSVTAEAFNCTFKVPDNPEKYLEFLYGDWQVPRKDVTLANNLSDRKDRKGDIRLSQLKQK